MDITFEQAFNPNVFPLGSLNGGGKSTLMQLIFVLLHCSAHSERHPFIANMLERVTIPDGENSTLLAGFELVEGDERIELAFTLCNDDYLRQLDIDPIFNKEMVSFGVFLKEKELLSKRANEEEGIKLRAFSDHFYDGEMVVTAAEQYENAKSNIENINRSLKTIQPLLNSLSENLTIKNQYYITSYSCNKNATGLLCQSSKRQQIDKRHKSYFNDTF